MSTTIPATITYTELLEGLEEGCNERGPWARKKYRVPWLQRGAFAQAMAGTASTTGPKGPWIRAVPYQYPDPIVGTNLYAREIHIRPEGQVTVPSTPVVWSDAIVTVTFGIIDWTAQATDDPLYLASLSQDPTENAALQYATQEIDFGSEFYDVPNSSVKFGSDGAPINGPVRQKVNVHRMIITWHRYPVMPMSLIQGFADSVNDATFLGCARGTVYFDGARTIREADSTGAVTQKVQFNFKWRQYDWNKRPREDGFSWDTVVDTRTGNPILTYRSFAGLLL